MRAAIFDLDGTLAETAPDLLGAANDLAALHDLTPLLPLATHRLTAGQGGKAMLRALRFNSDMPADEGWVDAMFPEFLDAYEARIDRESRLYGDVAATLTELEGQGWRLAVCTNKPERLARILLIGWGSRRRSRRSLERTRCPSGNLIPNRFGRRSRDAAARGIAR